MARISIIVAMDENSLIGAHNQLPWHLPNDLKHFKRSTLGKPVLMGRKTFESIGKPLPERENLVLTRDSGFTAPGCTVVRNLDEALQALSGVPELMVIGGAQIYALVLPRVTHIYLTRVHGQFLGDAWFPPLQLDQWTVVEESVQAVDERNPHPHTFILLTRRSAESR